MKGLVDMTYIVLHISAEAADGRDTAVSSILPKRMTTKLCWLSACRQDSSIQCKTWRCTSHNQWAMRRLLNAYVSLLLLGQVCKSLTVAKTAVSDWAGTARRACASSLARFFCMSLSLRCCACCARSSSRAYTSSFSRAASSPAEGNLF